MTTHAVPVQRTNPRRPHRAAWRVAGAVLGFGALAAVLFWPDVVAVEIATVTRGPLAITVDEEGETRVRDRYVVSAPVTGRVDRIVVEPGDRVVSGQILTYVRPETPALLDPRTRAGALAAVDAARAALGRARAEHVRALEAAAQAERERARARTLHEAGALSRQQRDLRDDAAEQAEAAAQVAAFAEAEAASALRQANTRLDTGVAVRSTPAVAIRAPIAGVVLRRLRESEAIVMAGEALVEVGDPSRLEVVADVLSADAVKIRAGARAIVDGAGRLEPVAGCVRKVEPSGFTKVSALGVEEQRVNVRLDVTDPRGVGATLGDGYRVAVSVVLWESDDVLRVPASALFRRGDGWAVYVVRGGRAVVTPIEVEHRGAEHAEVVAGLGSGATVVVFPPDALRDGARVVARPEP